MGACTPPVANRSAQSASTSALAASDATAGIGVYSWQGPTNVFPASLAAQPSENYDANNCELYVSDIGSGNVSVDGSTTDWVEVYIHTGAQSGQLLEVGMYTETTDGAQAITLAESQGAGSWETGYTYARSGPGTASVAQTVSDFAFFIDVQRDDGSVVRLWQSDQGHNYDFDAVFSGPPGHVDSGGDSTVSYANPDSYVFWQKDACGG
jgi:hypothetical protein